MLVAPRRPGDRQRPPADRVHHAQPAGRAADRRGAVRGRAAPGRSRAQAVAGRRRAWSWSPGSCCRRTAGATAASPARVRHDIVEGFRWTMHHAAVRTLVADDPDLQHHVRRRLVGAGALRPERLGLGAIGFGLLTTVVGGRRPARHRPLRLDHPPGQPRQHHAGRADHRDAHPSRAGADHDSPWVAMADLLRLRRPRVHLGHHLDHRPAAGRAARAAGPGRAASTWSASTAAWSSARRIGGVLAQHCGVTAPFWFAFVGSAVFVVRSGASSPTSPTTRSRWTPGPPRSLSGCPTSRYPWGRSGRADAPMPAGVGVSSSTCRTGGGFLVLHGAAARAAPPREEAARERVRRATVPPRRP